MYCPCGVLEGVLSIRRPPDSPVPSTALPAQAVNAPVFVPKTSVNSDGSAPASDGLQSQNSISSYGSHILHMIVL